MRPRLTPEQERAARTPGSIAITAGAGTGKTLLLAHRYLYHVLEERQSPLAIVAVTFTEKAAAELRARIRNLLQTELRPNAHSSSIPETETLDREMMLAELEAAQISTLHALCLRICQDHPEAAGVPHQVTILDEIARGLHLPGWIEEALDTLPPEIYDRIPYSFLHDSLPRLLADPVTAAWAFERDPAEWPALLAEERRRLRALVTTHPHWLSSAALLETLSGPPGDRIELARQAVLAALAIPAIPAIKGESDGAQIETLTQIEAIKLNGGSASKWGEEAFRTTKQAIETLRKLSKTQLAKEAALDWEGTPERAQQNRQMIELLPILHRAFRWVEAHIERAKRAARQLDFADLEHGACRALESPAVRQFYQSRWQSFLVDEFQDINPVQRMILDRLQQGSTLTIVGDEKQAIYGFRGADREVFEEVRTEIVENGGGHSSLSRSFRSHGGLIESFNQIFAEVLPALHDPLDAARTSPPHDGPSIRWISVDREKLAEGRNRPSAQAEAAALAEQITELLQRGHLVHDPKTQKVRPARARDVAILCRTWAWAETCHETLLDHQIPSHQRGGGDLLQTPEARDGLLLLDFLGDPFESLPLIGLLRSPFFTVSDRQLQEVRQANRLAHSDSPQEGERANRSQKSKGSRTWWATLLLLEDHLPPALARAVTILRQLIAARRDHSTTRLFQLANHWTGYDAVLTHLPAGEQRLTNWYAFLDLLQQIESTEGEDLVTVWRRLRRIRQLELPIPRPSIEAEDAVTVSTIHGAKGLEWPIVLLAQPMRQAPSKPVGLLFDPRLGVALSFDSRRAILSEAETVEETGPRRQKRPGPAPFELLKQRAKSREEAESHRLLYVAMTRARDLLLLTFSKEAESERLANALERAGIVEEAITPSLSPAETIPGPASRDRSPFAAGSHRWLLDPLPPLPHPNHRRVDGGG
jgi:ATP-dependent helicase/nuclease subunit A